MELFARFRRRSTDAAHAQPPTVPKAALPDVNQRVMVWVEGHSPAPSRVEDLGDAAMVLASPNLPLDEGDAVTVSWEGHTGWYSLETAVATIDPSGIVPTMCVSTAGTLVRHDERREDTRLDIALPLELRVVMARVVKGGRTLTTHTSEVSGNALRFSTSAPLAPGDMLEMRLTLREGEFISARVRVIRMDSVSGSWRQTCTAVYDDILKSDRSRIVGFLDAQQRVAGGGGAGVRLPELHED